jgi:hypothetical protein
MAEVASRVALLASVVLHATVLLGVTRPGSWLRTEARVLPDLWGGKTFEVPTSTGDPSDEQSEAPPVPIDLTGDPEPAPEAARASAADGPTVPARAPVAPRAAPNPARAAPEALPRLAAAGAPAAAGGAGNPGPYGAEGVAGGRRDLPSSFVRALPPSISAEKDWPTLPLGSAGHVDLTLTIDDEGRAQLKDPLNPSLSPPLRHLVQRTLILLASGRFSLSAANVASGTETLRMAVTLSQVEAAPGQQMESGGAFGLGFEPPTAQRPGRAFATLTSGRHVEVTVQLLHARR